jgi:hypothetical protein
MARYQAVNKHPIPLVVRETDIGPVLRIPARFLSFRNAQSFLHTVIDNTFLYIEGLPSVSSLSTLLAYMKPIALEQSGGMARKASLAFFLLLNQVSYVDLFS